MADQIRELSGEFATTTVTSAGTITAGPYRAFKILGGAVVVTTIGAPVLTSIEVLRGDAVLGHFTSIQYVSTPGGGVLVPYLVDEAA